MSGQVFDDPNREAVGLEPAWVEGTGGSEGETPPVEPEPEPEEEDEEFESLTKDELLDEARRRGLPANAGMNKAELLERLRTGR